MPNDDSERQRPDETGAAYLERLAREADARCAAVRKRRRELLRKAGGAKCAQRSS